MQNKTLTGYPSIDKPWLKYYTDEAINAPLPECTIYEYLYENNKDHLNDSALYYFGNKITYGELFRNIENAAKHLCSLEVKNGDIVIFITSNTPETIYYTYAANRIGAIADFVYPTVSNEELSKEILKTNCNCVVILDVLFNKFEKSVCEVKNVIKIAVADSFPTVTRFFYKLKAKEQKINVEKDYSQQPIITCPYTKNLTALIVHSGGTTGEPKGVELTNENINSIVLQYSCGGMEYKRHERFMHSIPPFHAFGFSVGIHTPLTLGLTVIGTIKFDEDYVRNAFWKQKPNHFVTSGVFVSKILNNKNSKMNWLKTFAVGGSSVPKDELVKSNQFLLEHHSKSCVVTGYGMSELSATVSTERNDCCKLGSVGIPLPLANIKIISTENGKEQRYGEQGEICVHSPSMMKQYYKNTTATEQIKVSTNDTDWIKTGDIGYIDEDGFLFVLGRIKRIYTTKTDTSLFKIFPDYIETVIKKANTVENCAVVCLPDDNKNVVPIAFCVVKQGQTLDYNEIKSCMDNDLPSYSRVDKIHTLDKIPLTAAGKIDYPKLEQMASEK